MIPHLFCKGCGEQISGVGMANGKVKGFLCIPCFKKQYVSKKSVSK